jgi:hypothetical protein
MNAKIRGKIDLRPQKQRGGNAVSNFKNFIAGFICLLLLVLISCVSPEDKRCVKECADSRSTCKENDGPHCPQDFDKCVRACAGR